jgi:putative component of toxin-antitoxin plasmid stabilization module
MKPAWTFLEVAKGITYWLHRDAELRARVDAQLRRMKVSDDLWKLPFYRPLGDGVGEIRVNHRKVEHRIYGYFGPGSRQFTMMFAVSGKQKQNKIIQQAKKLKKQYLANPPRLEIYDV